MNLDEICCGDVVTIHEGATLQQAAVLMESRGVGLLVVTSLVNPERPIGVLTDRDIVIHAVAGNRAMDTEKVDSCMTKDPVTLVNFADVADALALMEERSVRRLLVVDKIGNLAGVVSTDGLLHILSIQMNKIAAIYRNQIGTVNRHHAHEYTRMA